MINNQYPNDNYYELKYKCGNYETVTKFHSMIDAYELMKNLEYFLSSCSWDKYQIKDILRIDEDDVELDEEEEDE